VAEEDVVEEDVAEEDVAEEDAPQAAQSPIAAHVTTAATT
jgi:hypothetical protein